MRSTTALPLAALAVLTCTCFVGCSDEVPTFVSNCATDADCANGTCQLVGSARICVPDTSGFDIGFDGATEVPDTTTADGGTSDTTGGADSVTPDGGDGGCAGPCASSRDCQSGQICVDGCCVASSGGADTGLGGCGDVTFEGECDGSIVRWCDNGLLQELDCATYVEGQVGQCELVDPSFGYYCTFQPGSNCLIGDGSGGTVALFCSGLNPGCRVDADASVCVESVGTCDGDTFARSCIGSFLAADCNVTQPVGFHCPAFGATCTGNACTGIPEGGQCDGDNLQCEPGLACAGVTDAELGTCQ